MHSWYSHSVYVYVKILTSILRVNVYIPGRPACDWVYMIICLHCQSQVDLCLFCMNICTLMTLYGSKVPEFCEPRCGFPYTV